MNIPDELKYSKEHEWVLIDGEFATIGITDYAQGELGDIVYLELPEVDTEITINESFGSIEAVKAVSDLFAPLSGTIVEVNIDLEDAPEAVNTDPYGKGWMIKIKLSDSTEVEKLLSSEAYQKLL